MDRFKDYRRAHECIAQGALTNSKRVECLVKGVYPSHLIRGKGCRVWDTNRKSYIDYICGLGTNLLGYANDTVNLAMVQQMSQGAVLSLGTTLEMEVAERIKGIFPFVDAVKFLKTGSEACAAAVRIARSKTGRKWILSEGYHGWSDDFVSLTPPAHGVAPSLMGRNILSFDFGELDDKIAAVIVEPISTDISRERIEWLKRLREECTKHGALLIFDEIITGFRFPKYSVSNYFGIEPDIICLGKAIANGMPLSVVGGKYSVMNAAEYFVSSTFAGETISLAAAKSVMDLLHRKFSLQTLWERGQEFLEKFNAIWPEGLRIEGYPSRGIFKGDPMARALFFQETCKAGILFGPSWFFNFPLIEETERVISTSTDILKKIQRGEVRLEGEMPTSPFSQKVRGQ